MAMRALLSVLLLAPALLAGGCRSAPAWMKNGMPAPELEGTTVDGRPVKLSAERGKAAVVVFFADWCPWCRALYPSERELATRMSGSPFVLIGVAPHNSAAEIRDASVRERITWPVILDADLRNAAAWGVDGIPTTYVIDAHGVIRGFDLKGSSLVEAADALIAEAKAAK